MFETSPEVTPLLVRLYDSQRLYSMLKDSDPSVKLELTGAVVDLLERDLSEKEQDLLTDVMVALIKQAEKDLKEALSERLSFLDKLPLRLALYLANDEISVAAPMLKNSLVFSDLDLIYIIKSHGPAYWQAIAGREHLSDELIDILASTRDMDTGVALAANDRIILTRNALEILSDLAKRADDLAEPLLLRPEMPDDLAQRIYEEVGEAMRDHIRRLQGEQWQEIELVLSDVVEEFSRCSRGVSKDSNYLPSPKMNEAANVLANKGRLTLGTLLKPLKRGQIASFIAMFAKYTGISPQKIHAILMQPCGKGLAITCRAYGIQKSDFSRIYLLTHRMRSKNMMVDQKEMLRALGYFDRLRPEVAQRILFKAADF
ncbi:MAG: DUF2336 domain-containing protein [Rhodospirillales bacterium]|nr:DUF2336 domain-containing protein [Rhodospirillales bacterium]